MMNTFLLDLGNNQNPTENVISDCTDVYTISSEWDTGQTGIISFIVPTATSESNVKITFDKNVNGIKARKGKNEKCSGKVCTFTQRGREPLKKGQKLELLHRVGLESAGRAQIIDVEFNGEKICGIGTTTT